MATTTVGTRGQSQRMAPLTERKAWRALSTHFEQARTLHLRDLFAGDPTRGQRMTAEEVGLFLDYSKNRITSDTLRLLFELAEESGLRSRIDAMFRGDKINITENARGPARRPARTQGRIDRGRRRERGTPGPRRARPDGRFLQPHSEWAVERAHR